MPEIDTIRSHTLQGCIAPVHQQLFKKPPGNSKILAIGKPTADW